MERQYYEHKECRCLHCGHQLDDSFHVKDENLRPKIGDLSVCINCGTLASFGEEGNLMPLPDDALKRLKQDSPEDYIRMLKVQEFILKRNRNN